jgi:hypothetical protein
MRSVAPQLASHQQKKEERAANNILELNLDTFGDVTIGENGIAKTHAQVIRDVIDEAVLADELSTISSALTRIIAPISPYFRRR